MNAALFIWETGTGLLLAVLVLGALLRGLPVPLRVANWGVTLALLWPLVVCFALYLVVVVLREFTHSTWLSRP